MSRAGGHWEIVELGRKDVRARKVPDQVQASEEGPEQREQGRDMRAGLASASTCTSAICA